MQDSFKLLPSKKKKKKTYSRFRIKLVPHLNPEDQHASVTLIVGSLSFHSRILYSFSHSLILSFSHSLAHRINQLIICIVYRYKRKYPYELPNLKIKKEKGLSEAEIEELLTLTKAKVSLSSIATLILTH
jgi:hypothetical protein